MGIFTMVRESVTQGPGCAVPGALCLTPVPAGMCLPALVELPIIGPARLVEGGMSEANSVLQSVSLKINL